MKMKTRMMLGDKRASHFILVYFPRF